MAGPEDFQSVMAELGNFQAALENVRANLRSAKGQEILGDILDQLQTARADVEVEYPKAMNVIEESARSVIATAKQRRAQQGQRRAEIAQKAAAVQAAQQKAALPPPKPEVKVDPALGQKLRLELLQRFASQTGDGNRDVDRIREAWQDWD
jgi:hypothetical protein